MQEKEHLKVAEDFWKAAQASTQMQVQVQNYFYSAINYIEAVLAKKNIHSFSHEDRAHKIIESDLSNEYFNKYQELVTARNLAGYVGKNGGRLAKIREIAEHFRNKATRI